MTYQITSSHGCAIEIGDGGVGAGTQASKTIGTSNAQLKVLARYAGVAGNSKTFGIVVSGNNTPLSIVVTANSVLINAATDGSGLSTTTVLQAIAALAADTTFVDNFQATVGTGTGASVIVAGAAGVLSGGADGAEAFEEIMGMHNGPNGPGFEPQIIEARHHGSDDTYQKTTVVRHGAVTFDVYYDSTDTAHQLLLTNARTKVRTNFRMTLTDQGLEQYTWGGYVSMTYKGEVDGFNIYSCSLSVDGALTPA